MAILQDTGSFQIPWDAMDAIMQGKSPIDLKSLPIKTRDEAAELVASYGYDLADPADRAEVTQLMREAIEFIEQRLLSGEMDWAGFGEPDSPAEKIPDSVSGTDNVLDLIMIASGAEETRPDGAPADRSGSDRYWACAILKVLHTLVYVHNGFIYRYFEEASESILGKFNSILIPQADDSFLLKGPGGKYLKLYGFEAKYQKPRESILIKLLCKKENVAEDVWDLIGVRLITHTKAEAVQAINYLRAQKVIVLSNVMPSRTRNTLIDYDAVKADYEHAMNEYKDGALDEPALRHFFEQWQPPATVRKSKPGKAANTGFGENPSSSPSYHSIHITCRHLLKLKHPDDNRHFRFAFPYEIQVMDQASYLESKSGQSAHSLYKKKQLAAARRRVLGMLLTARGKSGDG